MAAGDLSLNILIGASLGGSFGATMGAATSAIQQLASGNVLGALATGAAAVGAAMVGAAKSAGDYQSSLTSLVTGAGEAQSNLKAVGDGILNISTQTGTSTKSLTDAMFLLESSGAHGSAGLQELTTAAEGAKVGNADLMDTANNLSTILTDYHIPAGQATQAMNAFITAVSDGKPPMQEWGTSLGNVLPLASSLGVAFPQVAGAISVMTNAGMTAQRASMDLANALRSLAAPGGAAQKAMASVGISAQQLKDTLTTQGLSGAIQLIEDHVGKTFPAGSVQAVEAFKKIMGGATGYNVALMLGGQNMSAYEGDIKNITAAMDKGGSSVQGWSLVQQDFNQKVAQAQAALNAMMITLGTDLLPVFGKVVDWVTQAVSAFTNWENQTHFVENALNAVVSAVQFVIDILGKLGDSVSQVWQVIAPAFDQLASDASTWGNNLMVSFGNGIIDAADAVLNAVEQIAQDIADYLGFQSPTKKGPGSTLARWGIGMVTGLAQGIVAAGPLVTNAVLSVASQLQTASTSGGILHTAVASMIDPLSGNAMTATVTPDPAISHPATGLNTTALKSSASATSHGSAATTAAAIVTAVKGSATTVSSAVITAASRAAAQKATTSKAAAAQRSAAMAQKAKTSAAAAAQRAAHTAAMQKAHAAAAAQRQHAAQQRAAHTAAMQKAHQLAAQQRQAAAAQRAKLHAEAQAKREQIHQALLQQRAAKAAAKAGPPAVAGALPNMDMPSLSKSLDDIKKKITDAFSPLKDAANNAKLLEKNISNSFTGIQAKAQELEANLKQFFDWLKRTFQPVWDQLSDTWNTRIIPDIAKLKKSFDDASPSLRLIVDIFGKLLALGLVGFLQQLAYSLQWTAYVIGLISDGVTQMVQAWLWVQQQLKPIYDWIVQGLQWVYDQIIGHSIIPDLINGIQTWFNKLISFFPNTMNNIKNALIQKWNEIKTSVSNTVSGIITNISQQWTKLKSDAATAWQSFNTTIQTDLNNLKNWIGNTWIGQLTTNMLTWGGNLIKMFGQGMTNALPGLQQVASNVAQTIKNFLGIQSPAAMGPLAQSHTWMPNLMKMFSQQITAGTPQVTSATNNMASSIQQSINQMVIKVNQSVQEMMQKIQDVGQTLQQMQSQVSSAVSTMRNDVQSAMSDANQAITSMENTVSNAVGQMNQSISSVSDSIAQMQSQVNSSVQQMNQQVSSVSKSMQNMQNAVNSSVQNVQNTVKASDAKVNAENNATLAKLAGNLATFAGQAAAGYAKWSSESAQAETQFAAEEQKAIQTRQYVQAAVTAIQATLAGITSQAQAAISSIDASIAAAATTVSGYFGHTEPIQGPLAGDSQWGVHFMDNFISGMQSQIPALASTSQAVATKIVENLLPNTKAMANDVKAALAQAAAATGDTITALKQKGDDIYATIQQLTSLTGTTGSPGTYAITTANVVGDIPVSYQLTPPTPGTAGSQTTQNMTVHIDLDGKSIGKYVGKYINQELHVQGQVRGR